MKEYKRVFAKVNLDNVEANMDSMHALVGDRSLFFAVIKADGYGHGAVRLAKLLEKKAYVYGYAVATVEEAVELRQSGMEKPILVLGYSFPDCYEKMVFYDIMPAVFREDSIKLLSDAAKKVGKTCKVHVKVDTGMGRIGIRPDEQGVEFVVQVLKAKGLELDGMFTHFARADEADKSFAVKQLSLFQNFVNRVESQLRIQIPHKHCANSASIMELPDAYLELVRAGISMYGLWPSEEMRRDILELKPALSLYSHVVYIKDVEPGTAISYGGTFVADKPMRVATIPVGYGDGYPRGLSNKGYVLIRGKRAPILGRVCMDQFMVDVTHIPEAAMDDPVTLIGVDGEERITMEELGALSGRFNYELACDLGRRIPRIYTYHEKLVDIKDFYTE
ncbi:MAG: alanine racemase [Lachnospiraceae bacterium]|nr:alanine racemase [Lachnospiraceae bacterium]